jgi:hypothetical protein
LVAKPLKLLDRLSQVILVSEKKSADILDYCDPRANSANCIEKYGKAVTRIAVSPLITDLAKWLTWRPSDNYVCRPLRHTDIE